MKATVNPRYQRYAISVSGATYARLRTMEMATSMQKFVDGILVTALDDPAISARVLARCTTRPTAWYEAIVTQLHTAGRPLSTDQIWQGMTAAGFQHASETPRSTLAARITELVQSKKIERVGLALYRLLEG